MTISPQTQEKSRELIEARKLNFPILWDEKNAYAAHYNVLNTLPEELDNIYRAFGINVEESNGGTKTLPIPGTYVIQPDGQITYASADADYTKRPEPADMLASL